MIKKVMTNAKNGWLMLKQLLRHSWPKCANSHC